jgi:hypothetical protein
MKKTYEKPALEMMQLEPAENICLMSGTVIPPPPGGDIGDY